MRSRVFVFLAVTLCFVFCLRAKATVSEAEAIKAANNAKRLIASALDNAGRELNKAEEGKLTMEWRKKKTEIVLSEAKDKVKRNSGVNAVVVQTISELENMLQLYPSAKDKIDNAVKSLTDVYLEARVLNEEANIKISPASDLSNDYANAKESASIIQTQAEEFQKVIENAKTLLTEAQATLHKMPQLDTNDKMEMYKADSIVISQGSLRKFTEANGAIRNVKQRKDKFRATIKPISEIFKKNSNDLSQRINAFLTTDKKLFK